MADRRDDGDSVNDAPAALSKSANIGVAMGNAALTSHAKPRISSFWMMISLRSSLRAYGPPYFRQSRKKRVLHRERCISRSPGYPCCLSFFEWKELALLPVHIVFWNFLSIPHVQSSSRRT